MLKYFEETKMSDGQNTKKYSSSFNDNDDDDDDGDDAAAVYDNKLYDERICSWCGQLNNSHWGSAAWAL